MNSIEFENNYTNNRNQRNSHTTNCNVCNIENITTPSKKNILQTTPVRKDLFYPMPEIE